MLKLMYITNDPVVADIAADAGVDRIFIDMEVLGKAARQGGMDTVQSHHVPEDILRVRETIGDRCEILARINPFYEGSRDEVEKAVRYGADWIMLPMWKTAAELQQFCGFVNGRAKTIPLLEHIDAANALDDALQVEGIDELFIGLNDLHLSLHKKFMFELLSNGLVEELMGKIRSSGIPCGFGGIARPGSGTLPAEYILGEHYRLGSHSVILSRSFCRTDACADYDEIREVFHDGIRSIREVERELMTWNEDQFEENRQHVAQCVAEIVDHISQSRE